MNKDRQVPALYICNGDYFLAKTENRLMTRPIIHFPSLIVYLLINALFVLKYAYRLTGSYISLTAAYVFLSLVGLFLGLKLFGLGQVWTGKSRRITLAVLVLAAALCCLVLLRAVDPMNIQVDRWSAIHRFLEALFNGKFPYAAQSHLGNEISGFPGLFALGLPFYLMGDVGLLQVFALPLFAYLAYRYHGGESPVLVSFILLILSPAFIYEILVRSELVTNMVLAIGLLLLSERFRRKMSSLGHWLGLGALSGLLLSTRGIVIIPILLSFPYFLRERPFRYAVAMGVPALTIPILGLLPFQLWAPDLFAEHNPLLKQSSFIGGPLLALVLVAAAYLGWRIARWEDAVRKCGIVLFCIVALCMARFTFHTGWHASLFANGFDISYFGFALPFVCLTCVCLSSSPGSETRLAKAGIGSGESIPNS